MKPPKAPFVGICLLWTLVYYDPLLACCTICFTGESHDHHWPEPWLMRGLAIAELQGQKRAQIILRQKQLVWVI